MDMPPNEQLLIPTNRHKILITGEDSLFRDHLQWSQFANSTIKGGAPFLDHQTSINEPAVSNNFINIFHHPEYEDLTKNFPSNCGLFSTTASMSCM